MTQTHGQLPLRDHIFIYHDEESRSAKCIFSREVDFPLSVESPVGTFQRGDSIALIWWDRILDSDGALAGVALNAGGMNPNLRESKLLSGSNNITFKEESDSFWVLFPNFSEACKIDMAQEMGSWLYFSEGGAGLILVNFPS